MNNPLPPGVLGALKTDRNAGGPQNRPLAPQDLTKAPRRFRPGHLTSYALVRLIKERSQQLRGRPREITPIFDQLRDSGFAGREWVVRESADHARSKTFRRAIVS